MVDRNLTAANSSFALVVAGLFPVAQLLQGYATDRMFEADDIDTGEFYMGVDGKLSAGWTANAIPMPISLQADSLSNDVFDAWIQAERSGRTKLKASAVIRVPALGKVFTFPKGYIGRVSVMPKAAKVLQPRVFTIQWEKMRIASM